MLRDTQTINRFFKLKPDINKRIIYMRYRKSKKIIKFLRHGRINGFFYSRCLQFYGKDSSISRIKNLCPMSGKSRGIYREYGLYRMCFKNLASFGYLLGLKQSSF